MRGVREGREGRKLSRGESKSESESSSAELSEACSNATLRAFGRLSRELSSRPVKGSPAR